MKPQSYVDSQYVQNAVMAAYACFDVKIHPPTILWDTDHLGFFTAACYINSTDHPHILLNTIFSQRSHWLNYDRDEVLAHDLVHHQRRELKSSKYEEIIAYQTSPNRFRRFWGGIFRSPSENLSLLLAALSFFGASIFEVLNSSGYFYRISTLTIFTCGLAYLILRHLLHMRTFLRVMKSLQETKTNPLEVLIHWDDARIDQAAQKINN